MLSFNFGNKTIEYTLYLNPLATDITISVEWLEGVSVLAPENVSKEKLNETLYKKAPWILKKWYELNEISNPPSPKEYISGEKFPYLGRYYRLKVIKDNSYSKTSLSFYQGRFTAQVPAALSELEQREQLYNDFKSWYFKHGQAKLLERLQIYSAKMDVEPSKIALKEQKMRWGTCTADGNIYLNWRIVLAPVSVLDYVLVHELAHLKYPNHSRLFWQFLHSIIPDYEHRKEWLRINGPTLTIDY